MKGRVVNPGCFMVIALAIPSKSFRGINSILGQSRFLKIKRIQGLNHKIIDNDQNT